MITFSSGVQTAGTCPSDIHPDDLLSRSRAEDRAEFIYDREPNLVASFHADSGDYVLKWFGWRHGIHPYLSPTFPSRAWASWLCAQALKKAGVNTPEPVWVYTRRKRGRILENIYLTRAVKPQRSLRAVLKVAPPEEAIPILENLGRSLARMHNGGIFHRDLTTGNFLVDQKHQVYIIDLNRARLNQNMSPSRRLDDLRKIHFPDRIPGKLTTLFWETYRRESGIDIDWAWLYRQQRKKYRIHRKRNTRLKRWLRRSE